eukprot:1157255-Pelagomonas_calceolata.AAC.1
MQQDAAGSKSAGRQQGADGRQGAGRQGGAGGQQWASRQGGGGSSSNGVCEEEEKHLGKKVRQRARKRVREHEQDGMLRVSVGGLKKQAMQTGNGGEEMVRTM